MRERYDERIPGERLTAGRQTEIIQAITEARDEAPALEDLVALMEARARLLGACSRDEITVSELKNGQPSDLPGFVECRTLIELTFALKQSGVQVRERREIVDHEIQHAIVFARHGLEPAFRLRFVSGQPKPEFVVTYVKDSVESPDLAEIFLETATAPDALSPIDKIVTGEAA